MPRVLVLLAEGIEEIEAITSIDVLRRAGAEVTVAALGADTLVTGRSGLRLHADVVLADVPAVAFDCLLLPGGPGVKHLRADPRVRELVVRHHAGGRWLAAICAAPTVLHDAGLLREKRYTAHPSVAAELPAIKASSRVVRDGRLITSRGAGTALDFALDVVEALFSADKRDEIARSICA